MADLRRIIQTIITPALAALPPGLDSDRARVLLLAIGLQESRFEHRHQVTAGGGVGPARGFWQFERDGGVVGVLKHPASHAMAVEMCALAGIPPVARVVWSALAVNDRLACQFARLLLYTDPRPLPALGHGGEAWDYYLRNWRPGKPHRKTWNGFYAQAMEAVQA